MQDQAVIDRAVVIANRAASFGHPVDRVIWMPPATAAENPRGTFVVIPRKPITGAQ